MSNDLIKKTFKELKMLGIKARLSNVVVTRSTTLCTPWTLSYVVHEDGYIGCGAGNNCFDVPIDLSFISDFIGRDVYQVVESLEQMDGTLFNNSLMISLASALSHRIMKDQNILKAQGFGSRIQTQACIADVVDLGMIRSSDMVAIVGFFYDFVAKIAEVAREVRVLELSPASDFDVFDCKSKQSNVKVFPATQNKEILSKADVVIITGMTIANNTAPQLLELAKNSRLVMMQGPTCSFYPKALFAAGVDLIGTMLFPTDEGFYNRFVNSRGYWYRDKGLKHMFISANDNLYSIGRGN